MTRTAPDRRLAAVRASLHRVLTSRRRCASESADGGFTLVEVVVASVLVGILAATVLAVLIQTQSAQVGNRGRIAAANLAAREIDLVREQFAASESGPLDIAAAGVVTNPHPLEGGTAGQPLSVDGTPYTVTRSAAWNITGDGASACEGGSLVTYPTMTVTVSVTWPSMGSIKPVVSQTVLAPDKLHGVPTDDSFVAVLVVDQAADPAPGHTVRVANGADIRTGLTDSSGCAVVQVDPASGTGTDYSVTVSTPGHVDMSGSPAPTKSTGYVTPGTLNTSVSFAYAAAASVEVRLVDAAGNPASADAAGSQVTLVASEYSGASGNTVHTLTGSTSTITGLWPTTYGAFYGTVAPAEGYNTVVLAPGGSATIDVVYVPATIPFAGLPAGTTELVAAPLASASTCSGADVRTFPVSGATATVTLPAGSWKFFVKGTYFSCSAGDPAGGAFPSGVAETVTWTAGSTLRVDGAPAGQLWAVDAGKIGTISDCPGPAAAPIAQPLSGTTPLLPGTWYVYLTDGAPDGACQGFLAGGLNPVQIQHNEARTVTWLLHSVTGTVSDFEPVAGSWWSVVWPRILVSSSPTLTCTSSSSPPTGATNIGEPSGWSGGSLTTTLSQGTWYVHAWDVRTSGAWSPNRCRPAGTFVVGPASSNLTLNYDVDNPKTVGP